MPPALHSNPDAGAAGELPDRDGEASPAVFISDLHLEAEETSRHRAFRDFLLELSARTPRPRLYILGDLFEYWAGRGSEKAAGHRFALEAIRRAASAGIEVSILGGNRDFLLDGSVGERCGAKVLPRSASLHLGPHRILACHGDLMLLGDRSHLRFRWILRSGWLRQVIEALPESWIERLASRLRRTVTGFTSRKDPEVFEVPPQAAARLFRGGYDVLICGHIHKASRRRLVVDGEPKAFYSLGAWEEEASVLEFDGGAFRFRSFPIPKG